MRVLFLTDEFYPTFGANSLVVYAVCEEMIKNSIDVFVMPFCYEKEANTCDEYEGVKIIRSIPGDNLCNLKKNLKAGHFFLSLKVAVKHIASKITHRKYLWSEDRFFSRNIIKDFIRGNKIDAVISINCSINLSFPIFWLKKHKQVDCKWLMYMLDPFESHEYYRSHYTEMYLRKIQHKLMACADAVVATRLIASEISAWEDYGIIKKVYNVEFPKVMKIRKQPCKDEIVLSQKGIHVICTGSKNEIVRDSSYTLAICERFPDITFHFIGIGWAQEQYAYKPNIIFYPPHSWDAVRNIQADADYLLNIGNLTTNQLPSKILEYISSGRPIINICKSEQCPTLKLLEKYDAVTVWETENIDVSVARIEEFLKSSHITVGFDKICENYREYTPGYVEKQFEDIFDELRIESENGKTEVLGND